MAGTIADKIQAILASKADIAAAIEEKGGTVPQKLSEYGDAIRALPTGDQEPPDIEFIDDDGTTLYKYTVAEFNELSSLPSYTASKAGYKTGYTMTCEGWNYTKQDIQDVFTTAKNRAGLSDVLDYLGLPENTTFSQLQSMLELSDTDTLEDVLDAAPEIYTRDTKITVGLTYKTSDGKTRIHITTPSDGYQFHLQVNQAARSSIKIYWGDGASEVKGKAAQTILTHTYSTAGSYTIVIENISSETTLILSGNLCANNMADCKLIECIELGDVCKMWDDTFSRIDCIDHISVPTTITEIGTAVFENCMRLKTAVLPRSSTAYPLKDYAFAYCVSLEKVSLPVSISSIGTVTGTINGSSFKGCGVLRYIYIPDSVTTIAKDGFNKCSSLFAVYGCAGCSNIGNYAFASCSKITRFRRTDDVLTTVGESAFDGCTTLASIPEITANIGKTAFQSCVSLKTVKASIASGGSVGQNAFKNSGVEVFDFSGCDGVPTYGQYAISGRDSSSKLPTVVSIIVPAGQLSTWTGATGWSTYSSIMVEA